MKKNLFFSALAFFALMLTSCLENGDNKQYFQGYFSVQQTSHGPVLHADGGGVVYPTYTSVSTLTGGKGLTAKRAVLGFSYNPDNLTENDGTGKFIIKEAELEQGYEIPVLPCLSREEALAKNLLESDSIDEFVSLKDKDLWLSNGYLTAVYSSKYYVVDNRTSIMPTMNLMLERVEDKAVEWNATLLLNRHKNTEKIAAGKMDLFNSTADIASSIDMTQLAMQYPASGVDSITINITYKVSASGDTKTVPSKFSLKGMRRDF